MRVALIYGENSQPAGDYFLGIAAYEANFANQLRHAGLRQEGAGVDAGARPSPRSKRVDR